ncbi:MAG: hypothetical protein K0S08_1397 [Gammaproteobacteria bacterium]|jgi:hypothetical protein|nr:hypothetical protein [Gammaproteobacteria bacterium]
MPKISINTQDVACGYEKRQSIADYLPWNDYNYKHRLFLLEGAFVKSINH